ncbi:MAG: outer membrane protein assembly factor BamE [Phycisphaerae bacterium]|nr:outer membrane protein assembly factor BamE [Phycisphaerae bacterium]
MPIIVHCPSCGANLKAPDQLAGKMARCKCGASLAVPGATDAFASSAMPPPPPPPAADAAVVDPFRPHRRVAASASGGGAGEVLKPLIIVAVLGGIGWAVYELIRFDPVAQGQEKLKKIGAGMTVEQVVAAAGRPQDAFTYLDEEQQKKYATDQYVAKIGFVDNFMTAHGPEKLRNGFYLIYRFTPAAVHRVEFDEAGLVTGIEEVPHLLRR